MEEQNHNSLGNEAGEQKEIETGEIKSFRSFLKLCYGTKTARRSIIFGVIIVFIGACVIDGFLNINSGANALIAIPAPFLFAPSIVISSLVVIRGTLWRVKKEESISFDYFSEIFTIIFTIVVFYTGLQLILYQSIMRTNVDLLSGEFLIFLTIMTVISLVLVLVVLGVMILISKKLKVSKNLSKDKINNQP